MGEGAGGRDDRGFFSGKRAVGQGGTPAIGGGRGGGPKKKKKGPIRGRNRGGPPGAVGGHVSTGGRIPWGPRGRRIPAFYRQQKPPALVRRRWGEGGGGPGHGGEGWGHGVRGEGGPRGGAKFSLLVGGKPKKKTTGKKGARGPGPSKKKDIFFHGHVWGREWRGEARRGGGGTGGGPPGWG